MAYQLYCYLKKVEEKTSGKQFFLKEKMKPVI